jgi:hypothetical protein
MEKKEIDMKKKIPIFLFFLSAAVACNLPVPGSTAPASSPTVTAAPKKLTPTPTIVRTATQTYPPADLPFTIDCSALPESRQADCDSFIAATRDRVYPVEREFTGVSLSQCYKEIHYVILPTDPLPGAGGISSGDVITYNQAYSIDLQHRYDVHELLHSISTCAGALDLHAFHGMILNAVYSRFSVYDPGYFEGRDAQNLNIILEDLLTQVKTASGAERNGLCVGILYRKMTIAYFDLGAGAVTPLYRSTIEPLNILNPPNAKLVEVWGGYAPRVEALMEKLIQDYKYPLDVPECGLTGH